jgi:hypothetical protein
MAREACYKHNVLKFVAALPPSDLESPNTLYSKLASANHTAAAVEILYMNSNEFYEYISAFDDAQMRTCS